MIQMVMKIWVRFSFLTASCYPAVIENKPVLGLAKGEEQGEEA